MRFDLTPASHRVLQRAAQLRLQRGIAAISPAKLLWALFEEEECRAATWLHEANLSLTEFFTAFGIQLLESPISAPAFPAGNYGVVAGQYAPPNPPSPGIDPAQNSNDPPVLGNPAPEQLPRDEESEHDEPNEPQDPLQDAWEPNESPKYSIYPNRLQAQKPSGQSRLQFYLDEQRMNIGLFVPELEDALETVAHRFIRQDRQQSIAVPDGIKPIAFSTPALTLTTEHLFLAVLLDNGDVGRWLRENGFEAAELYQRIEESGARSMELEVDSESPWCESVPVENHSESLYRLLDASANRGREAMRVLEDYARFMLDDADLTQRLKTFRHQFQDILQQFSMQSRLEARNTEHDVGTAISAEGEYHRLTLVDILSANFSRLQESLRSLEEFSKLFDPQIARQFEQLRYRCYTLQKDVCDVKTEM
ncbi:MAG: hypothetical protein FWG73_08950 [Planctomycetaceae bacterium]|nr:hypothetical protein [Planctomycetaceae bacterium]